MPRQAGILANGVPLAMSAVSPVFGKLHASHLLDDLYPFHGYRRAIVSIVLRPFRGLCLTYLQVYVLSALRVDWVK
jgi:hypothetical protein